MRFNLANFRKIKSSEHETVMQHPDGHEIHIDHARLRPQIKKQLDALPIHAAQGALVDPEGEADAPEMQPAVPVDQSKLPPKDEDRFSLLKQQYLQQMSSAKDMSGQGFDPAQIDKLSTEYAQGDIEREKQDAIKAQMQAQNRAAQAAQAQQMGSSGTQVAPPPGQAPVAAPQAQAPQLASYNPQQAQADQPKNIQLASAQAPAQEQQAAMPPTAVENPYAIEQKAAQDYQKNLLNIQNEAQKHMADANKHIQDTIQDIQAGHINPNQYVENMGVLGRIGSAVGLLLSGAGSGMLRQQNPVQQFIDNQIARNVQAQYNNKDTVLHGYLKLYGNTKDAADMAMATQHALMAAKFQQAGAMTQDPMYRQRAFEQFQNYMGKAQALTQGVGIRRGVQSANADAATKITALANFGYMTPQESTEAHKELTNLQTMDAARKQAFEAFHNVLSDATIAGKLNPQTYKRIEAQIGPLSLAMSRDAAGRFNMEEMPIIRSMFPAAGDDLKTLRTKFRALDEHTSKKLQSALLAGHGIYYQPTPANFGAINPEAAAAARR